MRIAYYTETYLPNMDGVVRSILQTREQLERLGDELYIFTCGAKKTILSNKDPYVFYYDSIPFTPYPNYRFAINPYPSASVIDSKKVQIIHSHGMGTMGIAAMRIARKRKLPLVGSFHTYIQYATHYISNRRTIKNIAERVAWKYLRWYYNKCDVIIAPSKTTMNLLTQHGFKNIKVVSNGIDLGRFKDAFSDRQKFGFNDDDAIFLFVGRLVMEKNLDVMIRASRKVLKKVPNAKFVIAGEGPAKQHYQQLVSELKMDKRFIFLGFVPESDLTILYKSADVFVFPSKFETQGLSGIEAMASGLPICGADYLSIKEIVKDGSNGTLFNPDDPQDCADKMSFAYENRAALSIDALKSSRKYSIQKVTQKLRSIYEELLE